MGQSQTTGVAPAGKQSLFAQVAMILTDLRLGRPALSRVEARTLQEASDALHNADGWRRFCASNGPCVDDDGKETYELFSRAAGAVQSGQAWVAYWGQVRNVGCTLHVLADGVCVDRRQLEAAEELCTKASTQPLRPRLVKK